MQDIMRFNHKEKRQDSWADYDPKKAIEGIRKSRDALKGVDRDTLQRDPGATWAGQQQFLKPTFYYRFAACCKGFIAFDQIYMR